MRRRFLAALAAALAAACLCSCSQAIAERTTVHLLAVGCNVMQPGDPAVANDALEVAGCLEAVYRAKGFKVRSRAMLGACPEGSPDHPTPGNIMRALRAIDAGPRDLAVFYWSGHGLEAADGEPAGMAAAPEPGAADGLPFALLPFEDAVGALDALPCAAVAILDCCYSGAGAVDDLNPRGLAEALALGDPDLSRTYVMAASMPGQQSYFADGPEAPGKDGGKVREPHSQFTLALLAELGWRHSQATGAAVESGGREFWRGGYLERVPARTSCDDLMDGIERHWPDDPARQKPTFNRIGLRTFLVP